MAYRFWNQISNAKYLKNGNIRSCTPSNEGQQCYSLITNPSHNAIGTSNPSGPCANNRTSGETKCNTESEGLGRFVTKTPPPSKGNHLELRDNVIHRIQFGTKLVADEARRRSVQLSLPPYQLQSGADPRKYDKRIKEIKKTNERINRVARLQPRSMMPFCAKNPPSLEREHDRPFKFIVRKVKEDQAMNFAEDSNATDKTSISSESESVNSQMSARGNITPNDSTEIFPNSTTIAHLASGNPLQSRSHVGNNITQYKQGARHFSTKTCRDKRFDRKIDPECCVDEEIDTSKKHPRDQRWNKCECCPEMLQCDEIICHNEYKFPCPCDKFPERCPIDCLPPCEDPPPPIVPLRRLPKATPLQTIPVCKSDCKEKPICDLCITPKVLPPTPCSPCPCVEPFVPHKMPTLKLCKKRIYQCQPCAPPPCVKSCLDSFVPPKYLPPIIPGDCECIEPVITDVPPLPRLKMEPVQQVPECKPGCVVEPPPMLKCVPPKKLPPLRNDCYCVEPPPLKPVKLVRLPKICVCPPPPDPKCPPEPCPPKADEVCYWQYPVKKLKNFWCPECRIPKKKYRWCNIHTRGQRVQKRKMSTLASWNLRTREPLAIINDTVQVRNFSMPLNTGIRSQETTQLGRVEPSPRASSTRAMNHTVKGHILNRGFATIDKFKVLREKCRPKQRCPDFKDKRCPDRARETCELVLPPLCCTPRKSPYPAFSECCEFHQLLTCECKETLPYLQPSTETPNARKNILPPVVPRHKVVDPIFEEQCVLHELCRPFGYTYTCDNFNLGEAVPITQRECFSPHRLPCCERDQICDFSKRPVGRTCMCANKERQFYRCECNCRKQEAGICDERQQTRSTAMLTKIRKDAKPCLGVEGKRGYSTFSQPDPNPNRQSTRQFSTLRPRGDISTFVKLARGMGSCNRRKLKGGGRGDCKATSKEKDKKNAFVPEALRKFAQKQELKKVDTGLLVDSIAKLKKKAIECERGSSGKRMLLMKQAECAAKAVGMRLVPDHDKSCKHADQTKECKTPPGGPGIDGGPQERQRPKNVSPECIPRHEKDQCTGIKHTATKCIMPKILSGKQCRARLPKGCTMPLPVCNQDCMAERCTCEKAYEPCCVTEAPYPAFSDCHPPFKRLTLCEHLWRDENSEKSSRIIAEMLRLGLSRRCYSTFVRFQPSLLEKVLSRLGDKRESKGMHQSVNCDCSRCCSIRKGVVRKEIKPDLRQHFNPTLPNSNFGEIDNFPADIFKEVDKENLISLAPKDPSPIDRLKRFIYNYAIKAEKISPNRTIDGFKHFEKIKEETYSGIKSAMPLTADESDNIVEENITEVEPAEADTGDETIVITGTNDLLYFIAGENKVVNLRPQIQYAHKTKVMSSPVCTHILLDCGELMLEYDFNLMNTIAPMRNRKYLPFGLSDEEYQKNEQKSVENLQAAIEDNLNPKA